MNILTDKLDELEELIKAQLTPKIRPNLMPMVNTPSMMPAILPPSKPAGRPSGPGVKRAAFKAPSTSGVAPASSKNPVKIAQQLSSDEMKESKIKQAKEGLAINSRGQWSLK